MKLLFENWRDYLKEGVENNFPYQIYCDLDGVLVDFEKGATAAINADLQDPSLVRPKLQKKYNKMVSKLRGLGRDLTVSPIDFSKENKELRVNAVRNYMYPRLQNDLEFWSDLEWMPDGQKLWDHIKNLDPAPLILTAPMRDDPEGEDHQGKRMWVEKNLNIVPERVIVEREKWRHAIAASGEQNVLIDDTYRKVSEWRDGSEEEGGGGIAIHHVSAVDTIAKLDHLKENSDIPEEPPE